MPISEATGLGRQGTFSSESDDVISISGVFDGMDSMKFRSTKTDGNVTVYGLGDDEDLIINGIGNSRHIPCARRRHLDEDLQRPSLDDEQELTDGPHARPAHTIADEVGAGAVLQCGRAY